MNFKKSLGILGVSAVLVLSSSVTMAEEYKVMFDKIEKPFVVNVQDGGSQAEPALPTPDGCDTQPNTQVRLYVTTTYSQLSINIKNTADIGAHMNLYGTWTTFNSPNVDTLTLANDMGYGSESELISAIGEGAVTAADVFGKGGLPTVMSGNDGFSLFAGDPQSYLNVTATMADQYSHLCWVAP